MSDEETRNIGDSKIVEEGWTPEANCIMSGTSETCKRPLDTHFYDQDGNRPVFIETPTGVLQFATRTFRIEGQARG